MNAADQKARWLLWVALAGMQQILCFLNAAILRWCCSNKDESSTPPLPVCLQVLRVDPGLYRKCDAWAQANSGRLEVVNTAVQADSDVSFDRLDSGMQALHVGDHPTGRQDASGARAVEEEQQHSRGQRDERGGANSAQERPLVPPPSAPREPAKGMRCTTCNCLVGTRESYREHCKTKWHKHNMRRKTRQLPPLSEEECELDMDLVGEHDGDNEFK